MHSYPIIIRLLLYTLTPKTMAGWTTRLFVLCLTTAAYSYAFETLTGVPVENPPLQYVLVVGLICAPLYALVMIIALYVEEVHRELQRLATTDLLTDLMNRRAFFDAMGAAKDGAMLIIDADHFKSINDRFGHATGDNVLVAIADHLRRNIRKSDILGRIGGEEFALFLVGADRAVVEEIGNRISAGFEFSDQTVPEPIRVTLSIGAAYSRMAHNLTELFERADAALYASKHAGRARMTSWQSRLAPVG